VSEHPRGRKRRPGLHGTQSVAPFAVLAAGGTGPLPDMLRHDYFAHGAFGHRRRRSGARPDDRRGTIAWEQACTANAATISAGVAREPEHRAHLLAPRLLADRHRYSRGAASSVLVGATVVPRFAGH